MTKTPFGREPPIGMIAADSHLNPVSQMKGLTGERTQEDALKLSRFGDVKNPQTQGVMLCGASAFYSVEAGDKVNLHSSPIAWKKMLEQHFASL